MWRVIATRRLKPKLASHAPKVRRTEIIKIIEGEVNRGSIITKIRTILSKSRRAIRRWVR